MDIKGQTHCRCLLNISFFSLSSTFSDIDIKNWSVQVQVFIAPMNDCQPSAPSPGWIMCLIERVRPLTPHIDSGPQNMSYWGLKERLHLPVPWMVQKNLLTQWELGQQSFTDLAPESAPRD